MARDGLVFFFPSLQLVGYGPWLFVGRERLRCMERHARVGSSKQGGNWPRYFTWAVCIDVFLVTFEQGRTVAAWSFLEMGKEGEVLPKVSLAFSPLHSFIFNPFLPM